ncbi:hypothetical protein RCL1_001385 [Eukaryota sp. TZLM3-RCL]
MLTRACSCSNLSISGHFTLTDQHVTGCSAVFSFVDPPTFQKKYEPLSILAVADDWTFHTCKICGPVFAVNNSLKLLVEHPMASSKADLSSDNILSNVFDLCVPSFFDERLHEFGRIPTDCDSSFLLKASSHLEREHHLMEERIQAFIKKEQEQFDSLNRSVRSVVEDLTRIW